jgi:hypothetical protein
VQGSHFLDPGNVWRSVIQRGDDIYIVTEGYGVGIAPDVNKLLGPAVFRTADLQIRAFLKPDGDFLGYPMDELNAVAGITGTSARPESSASLNATVADNGTINFQEADSSGVQPWNTRNVSVNYVQETISLNELLRDGSRASTVFDAKNELYESRTDIFDINGYLKSHQEVMDAGDKILKYYDPSNTHPYDKLEVTQDATGKVTAAEPQLEANIVAAGGSVGQIFGSALGRALAPDNQFAQLAVSTVAGLIGQKLFQTFTASLTVDASRFVAADFASVTGLDVAHAGIGAISSFLTAELGHELHFTGLAGDVFNAGAGGVTASVLAQVVDKMAIDHLAFDAAIGAIDWSLAATQAGYNVTNAAGSYLAHQFVPVESREGAIGGQLFGAVGSALGVSAALNAALTGVLGFLIPGLGSFFGTIVGTMLGDALAGDPAYPKAFHDVEILGSDLHFQNRLFGTDDNGNAAISQQMGDQVTTIANSYLDAVHGAAIDHRGKVMVGYNAGAAPYNYITGWFPNGTEVAPHFAQATDAIQEGVRELLMQTEVIGGDLLMKRAHQAFISGPHPDPNVDPTNFTDLVALGGDLSVAQDYENYLNNREAINAVMAANPDTAFTAGWIATFARVNDLGLNHVNASDLLGGLVGYLDSVAKSGLGAEAANASITLNGAALTIDIKVANGSDIPGSLSVFADQATQTSDAGGTTVHLVLNDGTGLGGYHVLAVGAPAGDGVNDIWSASTATTFTGTGGHDILIGSAWGDVIYAGGGFDFVDGGPGDDLVFGQDGGDILRGGKGHDILYGGSGDDTYVFNRGDGADIVLDDSGSDTLVFGTGISPSDVHLSSGNNNLALTVLDPANPAAADQVIVQDWFNPTNSIETISFADGTSWNMAAMLSGTAGNDVMHGGGAEAMFGGAGNDIYAIDNPGDAAVNALMAANVSMAGSRNSCRRTLFA